MVSLGVVLDNQGFDLSCNVLFVFSVVILSLKSFFTISVCSNKSYIWVFDFCSLECHEIVTAVSNFVMKITSVVFGSQTRQLNND